MTPRSQQTPRFALILIVLITATMTGCAALQLPDLPMFNFSETKSNYEGVDAGFQPQPFDSEETYHKVRQARSQNAIVLQVAGDKIPVRVLPLPPGQRAIYVSDLLKQTGVQKKLGSIEATLYRHSSASIGGIPMVAKMSPDGQSVLPESDYALQAGDRLRVNKAASPAMKGLFNAVLGL